MFPVLLPILTKSMIRQQEREEANGGQARLVRVSETCLASYPLFYITACLQES